MTNQQANEMNIRNGRTLDRMGHVNRAAVDLCNFDLAFSGSNLYSHLAHEGVEIVYGIELTSLAMKHDPHFRCAYEAEHADEDTFWGQGADDTYRCG